MDDNDDEDVLQIDDGAFQPEAAIVSGSDRNMESSDDEEDGALDTSETDLSDSSSDTDNAGEREQSARGNKYSETDELYYNKNLDDEDEAWVYKHLRSGQEEPVTVRRQVSSASTAAASAGDTTVTEQVNMLKPRYSDAILSCPCCFTTVCMDCQQHVTYKNQYRAMFVMNIEVHWDSQYMYDEKQQRLLPRQPAAAQSDPMNLQSEPIQQEEEHINEIYYSVHCSQCQTQVAALCLDDEIYHFFDCVATSA